GGGSGFQIDRREHPGGGSGAFLAGPVDAVLEGPGTRRDALAAALGEAIGSVVEPDAEISNVELFLLHRVRDGRDVYFVVNPTMEPQDARVRLAGAVHPVLWDPADGEERPVGAVGTEEGVTAFGLRLPPAGSV